MKKGMGNLQRVNYQPSQIKLMLHTEIEAL